MAYLCGECGTLMDVTKDFISKSDLRKLVEKWEQYELPGEYESLYKDLKELLKRGE